MKRPQMALLQISYVSTAIPNLPERRVLDILTTSQRHNAVHDITGLLICDRFWFMQVIEGPEAPMRALYARIRVDDRHRRVITLSDQPIEARDFGEWAMAWNPVEPAGSGQPLEEIVRALTEQVANPVTRGMLRKFVPFARAAGSISPFSQTPP
jgi:hypothetical protein